MTTYGTISTSPNNKNNNNLEYISRARQTIKAGLGTRRPWKLMFNHRSFNVPTAVTAAVSRLRFNLSYFRMNYATVALFILFLSLLWHPISLIVFILIMAAWLFLYFLRDQPLVLVGHVVDDRVVLVVMAVITVVVLLLTHATVNIMVAVSVGVVVVVVHAVFRKTENLYLDEEEEGLLNNAAAS
ncbi:hypothetical protein TanjilG_31599 [Lupinus angustifolius]|uniref:PRA1 family protein n=1 Tax=Lupinus angustifolius TaxID=3871 RepID=A0A4P1RJP9_LUPAN|nr:PREDICTED: PRA1 family protein F2-like [Lupinus angustifolius]OIW11849.1 hypothetical protein TanjilG_31599 [Lupinus angustifolius]